MYVRSWYVPAVCRSILQVGAHASMWHMHLHVVDHIPAGTQVSRHCQLAAGCCTAVKEWQRMRKNQSSSAGTLRSAGYGCQLKNQ
jgi:hypothetical protein